MGVADDVQTIPTMGCPLCGGPLQVQSADVLACQRGHELTGARAEEMAAGRVEIALWMAIEALESEAEIQRVMAGSAGGAGSMERADQASRDAKLLRDLAHAHLAEEDREGGVHGGS